MIPGRLGPLRDLEAARAYLAERDSGAPTAPPVPVSIRSTSFGNGWRYDLLSWNYLQVYPPRGLPADGFVAFWGLGDTDNPTQNGVVLSVQQRSFGLMVPETQAISYAVAAYRLTHVGEQLGAKTQSLTWRDVT